LASSQVPFFRILGKCGSNVARGIFQGNPSALK
jgi:hypothetical protein